LPGPVLVELVEHVAEAPPLTLQQRVEGAEDVPGATGGGGSGEDTRVVVGSGGRQAVAAQVEFESDI
jgi:hypothetical protein